MKVWQRLVIYVMATAIIEGFFIWQLFSYGSDFPPDWIYWIVDNVGLIIFNPLGQGPVVTGFLALATGILFMFLIICAVGEIVVWIIKGRKK
jgi:hypothetical protein